MKTEEIVDAARNAGFSSSEIMHRLAAFKRLIQYSTSAEREKCTGTQEFVMLPREVVEQALEALDQIHSPYWHDFVTQHIEALRAALDQPQDHVPDAGNMVPTGWKLVPVEPTDDMLYDIQEFSHILPPRGKRIWAHMLAAAPQPPMVERPQGEQEPVAMLSIEVTGPMTKVDVEWNDPLYQLPSGDYKLYTHPQPKREPLTDEEIDKLCPQFDDPMRREMWIIGFKAAHNIK